MTEFEKTKQMAEQGNAEAQNNLGYMYCWGAGVEQDYTESLRWYTKAAEQGHAEAQYNLGSMYYYGRGVEENNAEALKWYTKAAENGFSLAQGMVDRLNKKMESKND